MAQTIGFPTSSDIWLELEGKKVAVVQSYTAKATKRSRWPPLPGRTSICWN